MNRNETKSIIPLEELKAGQVLQIGEGIFKLLWINRDLGYSKLNTLLPTDPDFDAQLKVCSGIIYPLTTSDGFVCEVSSLQKHAKILSDITANSMRALYGK